MAAAGQQVTEWDANGKPVVDQPQEWDASGKPILPASSITASHGSIRPGDSRSLFSRLTTPTPDNPQDSPLRRGVNWLSNAGASGLSALSQVLPFGSPSKNVYNQTADLIQSGESPAAVFKEGAASLIPNPEEISHHKMDTSASLVGQSGALGAVEGVAPGLNAMGEGMKAAGGKIADVTAIGSDALDRRYGAKPGRGLSENRIVGASKARLKVKVDAALDPLSKQRQTVLAQSQAPPTDIRGDVNQPFHDLTSRVTDPKTGVADPAEIRALNRTRVAANFQQDPFTGEPVQDPLSKLPIPQDLEHMSPSDIAIYNSNLRGLGDYAAKDSPLADQAIKGAGANLRARLTEVAPESADLTRQIHNTETSQDILQRQLRGSDRIQIGPRSTLFGTLMDHVAAPVTRLAGTATGAGLDAAGSTLKSIADKISPPGPPVAAPAKAPGPLQLGPGGNGQPIITPPPAPTPVPPTLPAQSGPTIPPTGQTPPNAAGLVERTAPRPGDLLTKVRNPKGNPVQQGVGGMAGPESRVTTRTPRGFGPKVDAPAFTIPPKQLPASIEPAPKPVLAKKVKGSRKQ